MKAQFGKIYINTAHMAELCAIRDDIANCDVMSCTEASEMIDFISLGLLSWAE